MLEEMPPQLMDWWRAFDAVEPIGGWAADWRAGMICSGLSGAWGGKRQPPEEFFPSLKGPEQSREPTWQEQRDWLKARFAGRG